MRKFYPYLQNPYDGNLNSADEKISFLHKVDSVVNQRQYVKLTLLNWDESAIKTLDGIVSSGTLTKDGTSTVRRSMSLSASLDGGSYDAASLDMDFSINKKIFVEIGVKNETGQYQDYPILWFPQGVFFISSCSISSSTSGGVKVSLNLKDKMSMLNGDVGGRLPAVTIFDEEDTQSPSGKHVSKKVPLYGIIRELVNHFGGEDLNNILIEDVDLKIRRVVKWVGDTPLYLISNGGGQDDEYGTGGYLVARTEKSDSDVIYRVCREGDDAGYVYDDFVYTGDLTSNLGDTICSVLDKIKNYLGNYEYFYDEYGIFHFREIKNYLNTTQATTVLNSMNASSYLVDSDVKKDTYVFSDNDNLSSLTCNPQYGNIRNDFIVQGKRSGTSTATSADVRYHLAIDEKPRKTVQNEDGSYSYATRYNVLMYVEPDTNVTKAAFPLIEDGVLPEIGNFNVIYYDRDDGKFYYWDDQYKEVDVVRYYRRDADANVYDYVSADDGAVVVDGGYTPSDWRTELYIQGLEAASTGVDSGYYFPELESGWPSIYDIDKQRFIGQGVSDGSELVSSLCDGNYFLDFIDPSESELGQYSVKAIGRRSDVVTDADVNCLFAPDIPDTVFINIDDVSVEMNPKQQAQELMAKGEKWSYVHGQIYDNMATGGYKNGAFDRIKSELYKYTNYQRSLSLTAIPAFYLEPNTRVTVKSASENVFGSFLVKSISYTLGNGSTMSVSANEVFERF